VLLAVVQMSVERLELGSVSSARKFNFSFASLKAKLKAEDASNDTPLSCEHQISFFIRTCKIRITTYPVILCVDIDLLWTLSLLPVVSSCLIIMKNKKVESVSNYPVLQIAYSRAKGFSSNYMSLLGATSYEVLKEVTRTNASLLVIKGGEFLDNKNCMQIVHTNLKDWRLMNLSETDFDISERVSIGTGLVIPKIYYERLEVIGFPMAVYFAYRDEYEAEADSLLLDWLSRKQDSSIDPIAVHEVTGIASVGMLLFSMNYAIPYYGSFKEVADLFKFLKYPSGQKPHGNSGELFHLWARDEWSFGVERLFLDGDEFFGSGVINWCIRLLSLIVSSAFPDQKLPEECIHVGEVLSYVMYALFSGDSQTLHQVIGQLLRRTNKVMSNLRLKTSHHKRIPFVSVNDYGWSGYYVKTLPPTQSQDSQDNNSWMGKGKKKKSPKY